MPLNFLEIEIVLRINELKLKKNFLSFYQVKTLKGPFKWTMLLILLQ